jgi:hypothetical protein
MGGDRGCRKEVLWIGMNVCAGAARLGIWSYHGMVCCPVRGHAVLSWR